MIFCILVFLTLLQATGSAAQDTVWYDNAWKKTVKDSAAFFRPPAVKLANGYLRTDYYKNGKIQMRGISSSNETNVFLDTVKWFYETGSLKQVARYNNGVMMDTLIAYHENGQVSSKLPLVNGKSHGLALGYRADGTLYRKVPLLNGEISGTVETLYDNGGIFIREVYVAGKKHGPYLLYNEQGVMTERAMYVANKREGWEEEFYPSGKLKERTFYKNNQKAGRQETYLESGQLVLAEIHSGYKKEGAAEAYYPNGAIKYKGMYSQDLLHGPWRYFDDKNRLLLESEFKNGFIDGHFISFHNGKKQGEGIFKDGLLTSWTTYYPSGKIFRQATIDMDSLTERWITRSEQNKKLLETVYRFNSPYGEWKLFQSGEMRINIKHRAFDISDALRWRRRIEKKETDGKTGENDDDVIDTGDEVEDPTEKKRVAGLAKYRDIETVQLLLPPHYLAAEEILLSRSDLAFDELDDVVITKQYAKGLISFSTDRRYNALPDLVVFDMERVRAYSLDSFKGKLEITARPDPDWIRLIRAHESYQPGTHELAIFAESGMPVAQRVIRFGIGSGLKRLLHAQPELIYPLCIEIPKTADGYTLAEIAAELCRELYDKEGPQK